MQAGTWQSSAIKGWHPYLSAEAMASVSMDESILNEIFFVWLVQAGSFPSWTQTRDDTTTHQGFKLRSRQRVLF